MKHVLRHAKLCVLATALLCASGILYTKYTAHERHSTHIQAQSHNLRDFVEVREHENALTLTTLYGTTSITEPVLIELIKSPAFNRLKELRQYGVMCHSRADEPEYTRYQHSLAVFFITRQENAPLAEQIAALLHDVSHTAFSHVGDRVFGEMRYLTTGQSYQDEIHEQYLAHTGIMKILEKYGFADACSEEAKKTQRCFDQDLPNLGADRIEYNLTGGFIDKLITREELLSVRAALRFETDTWFFDTIDAAKKFGLISLKLPETRWGSAWSAFIDSHAAKALKRACVIGLITRDEIHYSTDDVLWNKLATSTDQEIAASIDCIKNAHKHFTIVEKPAESAEQPENILYVRGKFTGTNPLVKVGDTFKRLTELDAEYAAEFNRVKALISAGFYIKIF